MDLNIARSGENRTSWMRRPPLETAGPGGMGGRQRVRYC